MNTKIRKVIKEIEQTEQRISDYQNRLRELHKEKVELENIEIIGMFRSAKISTHDISEVMKQFKEFQSEGELPQLEREIVSEESSKNN